MLRQIQSKNAFLGAEAPGPHASDHLVTGAGLAQRPDQGHGANGLHRFQCTAALPFDRYGRYYLPSMDWMWEERNITLSQYGGFGCVNSAPAWPGPPGESKTWLWVYVKLAEKLGIDPREYFRYLYLRRKLGQGLRELPARLLCSG